MIRLVAKRERAFDGAEAILAEAMESILPGLQDLAALQAYGPAGKDLVIEVVLGGAEQAARYGVPAEAVGFFAVCSDERFDPDDEDEERGWYDVPEGFEAHKNVEVLVAETARSWPFDDEVGRAALFESTLVGVAHEVVHVLEWIRQTGGKTPLEVFDEGQGELSLKRALDAIEAGRGRDGTEDEVEELARAWVESVFPFVEANAWVDRLAPNMPEAAPAMR